jgi:nucleotide-binding universal stress UspA family protein
MVMLAWAVNITNKDLATLFGGTVAALGMLIAIGVREGWFMNFLQSIPVFKKMQTKAFEASEDYAEEVVKDVVSVDQAKDLKPLYPASTLIALRGENTRLLQEGITRAKGKNEHALYCIYVEEWPGLFAGDTPHTPNEEGIKTLRFAMQTVKEKNIQIIPIWAISYNAAEAIAKAAEELDVDTVMVGTSRRSALYHMLRGHIIKGLAKKLSHNCRLMIYN